MGVALRNVLDETLELETIDLIGDKAIMRAYRKAVHWYRKYRLWPRTNTCTFSIENGDYVPDIDMEQTVVTPEGETVPLKDLVDTKTRKFNGTGSITVSMAITSDNGYLAGMPKSMEALFVAYCKIAIGQKLKFASYQTQPFNLDGSAIRSEGETERAEWEKFIMINRDEDPENITDLRKEAYRGVRGYITLGGTTSGGIVLW